MPHLLLSDDGATLRAEDGREYLWFDNDADPGWCIVPNVVCTRCGFTTTHGYMQRVDVGYVPGGPDTVLCPAHVQVHMVEVDGTGNR